MPNSQERLPAICGRRAQPVRYVAAINEISFLAWAGGEEGCLNPFVTERGPELKRILVRAAVLASERLLEELPSVRLVSPEPAIHVVANPEIPGDEAAAERFRLSQFEAWDMLSGRSAPELGGRAEYLDILGVNFYEHNQWVREGPRLTRADRRYRPFRSILKEIWDRYRRPLFVSETGTEDDRRVAWFEYVCDEVAAAIANGVPVAGICLYPVLNHPGWDNDRHCANGLFDYPDEYGRREIHWPLAQAITRLSGSRPAGSDAHLMKDVICLSHLRWGFVFQRPQHLMKRFATQNRVFFWEEPVREDGAPHLRSYVCPETGVRVCTPVVPPHTDYPAQIELQKRFLKSLLQEERISDYLLWYYTPMALDFSRDSASSATVYDCMDELSGFAGAPPALRANERALFQKADLVFTGGASLFESKRLQHESVHLFPSSVDVRHFEQARTAQDDPPDQAAIGKPRLGYAGVIDERMDLELIRSVAAARPEWQLILLGPVVKIDPATLPQAPNIHYLGIKQYKELPRYLAGWQVGMLPFALNDATRYISPTKTPEYLAAGLRVISTPIRDVVSPYGDLGLAGIARTPDDFVQVAGELLEDPRRDAFLAKADAFLARNSWDDVWSGMNRLIAEAVEKSKEMANV